MAIDPSKSKLATEHKHESPLLSCAFDPTGRFLFAGGRDRGVVIVNLASNKKNTLTGHESWVGVMERAAGNLVLTGDFVGRLIAWDCSGAEPKQRWSAEAHASTICGLSVSADGKSFATADRDGIVRVWQTSDGKRLHELPRIEHPVYGVALHPDGKRLVTADRQPQKPRIKVWDIASGKEQLAIDLAELSGYRRVEDIEWGGIRGLTVSPDGKQIVACGRTGYDGPASAYVFDVNTGKQQRKLASTLKGFYYAVKFHPQGFLMTTGGDVGKGEFRAWNPEKDASLADVATPGPCTSIDIHPDGKRFAVTQTIGKGSYPDSGTLIVYDWIA
ncbi:MAG: hypothetical protein K8T89_04680 [Planctomycetes bacterium]|nr:hypothetical protein [Planctomycetota bacterium]